MIRKLLDNGNEVALFPMDYLRITQGRYGSYSHSGYNAYDLAGRDGGIDNFYAPFSLRVEWLDPLTKTGVVLSNSKSVLMANGKIQKPRTLLLMVWHANSITHLRVGQEIAQGVQFYKEGTAGQATGNHIHMELSYGKFDGYPLYQLKNGYWTLKGTELNIEDCFFVNERILLGTAGYKFKEYIYPKTDYIGKPIKRDEYTRQIQVHVTQLITRNAPKLSGVRLGYASVGIYPLTSKTTADGYTWYQIGTNMYAPSNGKWITELNVKEKLPVIPEPPKEPIIPEVEIPEIELPEINLPEVIVPEPEEESNVELIPESTIEIVIQAIIKWFQDLIKLTKR